MEEFANDLVIETANGRGDSDKRKQNVRELLNFFPVYSEDEDGEMISLDAEKVLSIPRTIHAKEVVRRGFMSNFLFQNIGNIFNAPKEVLDIIQKFEPVKEPVGITEKTKSELNLDDSGDIKIPEQTVIGTATEIFGEKLYGDIEDRLVSAVETIKHDLVKSDKRDDTLDILLDSFHVNVTDTLVKKAKEDYGADMSRSTQNALVRKINTNADSLVKKHYGDYRIQATTLESERQKMLDNAATTAEQIQINKEFEQKQAQARDTFLSEIRDKVAEVIDTAGRTIVETVETDKKEKQKNGLMDKVRDHLRGLARTIPSFLMAYGDENTTLENFDTIIPDNVFIEVTSISLDEFRCLRDGFDYVDDEGKQKHYNGFFDPIVFNDSVREFLNLKKRLCNYFDENSTEDIFDYIPPQKTNQIFTPKKVVKLMVDKLEEENPGCFDDPDKTFIDLYMKSGLYIAEIVKRLYRSEKMKELFPDNAKRLNHIFSKQVYGLAPTEIIYRIAVSFVLGFDSDIKIDKHNLKHLDTLPYAQNGGLEEKLDEVFAE